MSRRILLLLAIAAFGAGCSDYQSAAQYQEAASVTDHLQSHAFVLQHTPAGSYSYIATSLAPGKVGLTVAGVTNKDDQDAILNSLRSHRFDKDRGWDEIRVLFYQKAILTPQGVTYFNLLRQEIINS
jgi:hypothetical protein